jgi:hypothetical protein
MELVKTPRPLAAILGHPLCKKRTAKICFGLIAAVFLLQFYYVREPVFVEAVVVLGFVVAALIGALYALGYIAALWLRRLGSELKALGALVNVGRRQPFTKTTVRGLSEAKQEVPSMEGQSSDSQARTAERLFLAVVNQAILDVLEHGDEAEDAERWLLSKDFDALQSLFH